jgi:DNA primase
VAAQDKEAVGVPRLGDWTRVRAISEETWRGLIHQQEVLAAEIRVLTLPPGTDPDEVIRRDPDEWRRLVEGAKPMADHLFEALAARLKGVSSPLERSRAAMELVPVLEGLMDSVAQATYVQRLARALKLDTAGEETVLRALRRRGRRAPAAAEDTGSEPALRPAPREPREEYLLALLLRYPVLRRQGQALSPDLFSLSENRQLFEAWRIAAGHEVEDVIEEIQRLLLEELHGHLGNVRARDIPPFEAAEAGKALEDCIWRMEQRKLELEKLASSLALAESEQEVGPARLAGLARSIQEGTLPSGQEADFTLEAATALVEDTEAGIRVHRRPLERDRNKTRDNQPRRGDTEDDR